MADEIKENQKPYQYYEILVQILHREVESLLSRLNFLLVGTAFLVAAFITAVIASTGRFWGFDLLSHAIAAIGFYVCLIFTLSNYLNAIIIEALQKRLQSDEELISEVPYKLVDNIVKQNWAVNYRTLWLSLKEVKNDPVGYSKEHPFLHTWLIPLLFGFFWMLVWLFVPTLGINKDPHSGVRCNRGNLIWRFITQAFPGSVVNS